MWANIHRERHGLHQPAGQLPARDAVWGGKNSGYGRELSELGFAEFTNRKLINVFPAGAPVAATIAA
jgi:acyl-CoA reductase-like NAD-dependent aldehyde dehydrogenase